MRLLLVEDEKDIREAVALRLKRSGFGVDACADGEEAIDFLEVTEYDAIILDIMLPGVDGLHVLRRLRNDKVKTPVLLLTARDAVDDRVRGLDAGADDYLVKPFAFEELLARLRALLRRPTSELIDNRMRIADLELDLGAREARRGGQTIRLSPREFGILEILMRNAGIIMTRERIEQHVYNYDFEGGSNVIDVYMRRLRRKIDDGYEIRLIHTVRGTGYVLREEEP